MPKKQTFLKLTTVVFKAIKDAGYYPISTNIFNQLKYKMNLIL